MPAAETDRLDLYNGLCEKLGPDLADNLMRHLPSQPISRLATKDDLIEFETRLEARLGGRIDAIDVRIDGLDVRIGGLDGRIGGLDARIGRVEDSMVAFNKRLDTMHQTMATGLIAIVATMIAGTFFG